MDSCWISSEKGAIAAFLVPMVVIIMVCLVIYSAMLFLVIVDFRLTVCSFGLHCEHFMVVKEVKTLLEEKQTISKWPSN